MEGPMICLCCGLEHDGSYGSGKYCSRRCANSRKFSEQSKKIKSEKQKKFLENNPEAKQRQLMNLQLKANSEIGRAKSTETKRNKLKEQLRSGEFDNLSVPMQRARILQEQKGCCALCGAPQVWNNQPLSLELDHISGDRADNRRANLRLICPNCHSQTPTFKSKNIRHIVSDENFLEALQKADSIHQACKLVALSPQRNTYQRAYKLLAEHSGN